MGFQIWIVFVRLGQTPAGQYVYNILGQICWEIEIFGDMDKPKVIRCFNIFDQKRKFNSKSSTWTMVLLKVIWYSLMEYSFTQKEKGINYWASSSAESDDREVKILNNDPFGNIPEMMNFEGYAGWCSSPSVAEQLMASYGFGSLASTPSNYAPYDQMNFSEQQNATFPTTSDNVVGSPLSYVEKMVFPNSGAQFSSPPIVCSGNDDSGSEHDNMLLVPQGRVPRPLSHSLSERMLHALSLFKESSRGGILAQMWVPFRSRNQIILSTCEQPYLLDQTLLGYREISRSYTFSAEEKPGTFPGLPGRVFISKIPEWTSNISYYSSAEYLRVQHALDHEVRGSVAIPIFSPDDDSCCAVLELVTVREKPNFDSEIESVCRALEGCMNTRHGKEPLVFDREIE